MAASSTIFTEAPFLIDPTEVISAVAGHTDRGTVRALPVLVA